jgi:hypothetical protein
MLRGAGSRLRSAGQTFAHQVAGAATLTIDRQQRRDLRECLEIGRITVPVRMETSEGITRGVVLGRRGLLIALQAGYSLESPIKRALAHPLLEAGMERGPGAELNRQRLPLRPGAKQPDQAVQEAPIVARTDPRVPSRSGVAKDGAQGRPQRVVYPPKKAVGGPRIGEKQR